MFLKCKNIKLNLILEKNIDISHINNSYIEMTEKQCSFILRFIMFKPLVITIYKHSLFSLHATGVKSPETVNQIMSFVKDSYPKNHVIKLIVNN